MQPLCVFPVWYETVGNGFDPSALYNRYFKGDIMKLNEEFIMHNTGEEILLVPTAAANFHGLVQGNKAVEVILSCLQNDTTEEEILSAMKERFDGDENDMREDILETISKLKEIGAIDD